MGTNGPDFQQLFEAAPGLYLVLRPDLGIVAVSSAYLKATMTQRADMLGKNLFEVFPDNPDDPAADGTRNLRDSLTRVLASREPHSMAVQKYDIRRPDGTFEVRHWSPMNTPVLTEHGDIAYIIHRVEDVTAYVELRSAGEVMEREIFLRAQEIQAANRKIIELNDSLERRVQERTAELRRAEEKLRLSQKMEAVGRLTGGIAHDFNNMLAVILTYASMLSQHAVDADAAEDVEQIRRAAERAAALTRQLLSFSSQQITQPRVLSLNTVVTEIDRMLRRILGEGIELRTVLGAALPNVYADPSQIDQVIANLVVNARDAMPSGGTITIQTEETTLDNAGAPPQLGVVAGRYVLLSVTDTGTGMDAVTLSRIFEPFFTTKDRGKGTGLGLATVYGITKQAGGYIWAYSEVGHGTVFKVYLPVATRQADRPVATIAPAVGGNETVLVLDDEPLVRAATCAILRRSGYTVHEAGDGADALAVVEREGPALHLIVTDLVMPTMSGRVFVERVRAVTPGMRVLYMSGYTDNTFKGHVLESSTLFLQKPFTPDALLRLVREALATRADSGGAP